jgi:hypothetical protein
MPHLRFEPGSEKCELPVARGNAVEHPPRGRSGQGRTYGCSASRTRRARALRFIPGASLRPDANVDRVCEYGSPASGGALAEHTVEDLAESRPLVLAEICDQQPGNRVPV